MRQQTIPSSGRFFHNQTSFLYNCGLVSLKVILRNSFIFKISEVCRGTYRHNMTHTSTKVNQAYHAVLNLIICDKNHCQEGFHLIFCLLLLFCFSKPLRDSGQPTNFPLVIMFLVFPHIRKLYSIMPKLFRQQ